MDTLQSLFHNVQTLILEVVTAEGIFFDWLGSTLGPPHFAESDYTTVQNCE